MKTGPGLRFLRPKSPRLCSSAWLRLCFAILCIWRQTNNRDLARGKTRCRKQSISGFSSQLEDAKLHKPLHHQISYARELVSAMRIPMGLSVNESNASCWQFAGSLSTYTSASELSQPHPLDIHLSTIEQSQYFILLVVNFCLVSPPMRTWLLSTRFRLCRFRHCIS
jgi:hypothetical protein